MTVEGPPFVNSADTYGAEVLRRALFTVPPGTRPKAKVNPTGFSYDLVATGAQTAARCSINSAGVAALNVALLPRM
jgi:hypothetical protein